MNGDHITAEVIILMGTTALMETDRVARVRMITVMAVTTNRITAIMVETVATATLIVKAARTRPKFIGGCRAVYDDNM